MSHTRMSFFVSPNKGKRNIEDACETLGFHIEKLEWCEFLSGTKIWVLDVVVNENSKIILKGGKE